MTQQPHPTPLSTFNFRIEIRLEGRDSVMCDAAFAECDGLEISMQPKTYQEGGNNNQQIQLVGPVAYGQLTLKRGMTDRFDLWSWFDDVMTSQGYGKRAECVISILSADREADRMQFLLSRCLPTKLKAPALNAREGAVAIEELQVAYERLQFRRPDSNTGNVA